MSYPKSVGILALICFVAHAHMQMSLPAPRQSVFSAYYSSTQNVDYSMTAPLESTGSDYPCKGKPAGPVEGRVFKAGESIFVKIVGSANHGGGHCQFAISYDNGLHFTVIHTVVRSCILNRFNYTFQIPTGAPACESCIFAWTWINAIGNREYYMNCADIKIEASSINGNGQGFSGPSLAIANLPGFSTIPEFPGSNDFDGSLLFKQRCLSAVNQNKEFLIDPKNCSNIIVSSYLPPIGFANSSQPSIRTPAPPTPAPTPVPTPAPAKPTPTKKPTPTATLTPATPTPTPSASIAFPGVASKRIVYIDYRDVSWNNPTSTITLAVQGGYNVIIVSFWLSTGPVDFALSWSQSSQSAQQNAMKYVHENNATVLISAGGSTETPYTTLTGNAYGLLVAKFAIDNNFDGVDFDSENFGPGLTASGLTSSQTIQWLVDATNSARSLLGPSKIITHAPQAPYFGKIGSSSPNAWTMNSGGYSAVYAGAPTISWFNVQFYNQGGQCYTSYASLFLASNSQESCPTFPGTSVSEIAAYGVPLNKIVVGKYLLTSDASNGFVSASALAGYFLQAYQSLGWQAGVMCWAWKTSTSPTWIQQAWPFKASESIVPTVTPAPVTPVPSSSPTSLPTATPLPGSTCGSNQCCPGKTCAQSGLSSQYCCSIWGFCGTSTSYCGFGNCLSGACLSEPTTKPPTALATVLPTQLATDIPTKLPVSSTGSGSGNGNIACSNQAYSCEGCDVRQQDPSQQSLFYILKCPNGSSCSHGMCMFGRTCLDAPRQLDDQPSDDTTLGVSSSSSTSKPGLIFAALVFAVMIHELN